MRETAFGGHVVLGQAMGPEYSAIRRGRFFVGHRNLSRRGCTAADPQGQSR